MDHDRCGVRLCTWDHGESRVTIQIEDGVILPCQNARLEYNVASGWPSSSVGEDILGANHSFWFPQFETRISAGVS